VSQVFIDGGEFWRDQFPGKRAVPAQRLLPDPLSGMSDANPTPRADVARNTPGPMTGIGAHKSNDSK